MHGGGDVPGGSSHYAHMTQNETKNPKHQDNILKQIGSRDNMFGEKIKVLLGSPVSGVGLTIPNATIMMAFGGHPSPVNIIQPTLRINRPGSLKWLESEKDKESFIYLFTAYPKGYPKKGDSIDLHLYDLAQAKFDLIDPQLKLIKEADLMCEISYDRNVEDGQPFSCAFANSDEIDVDTKTDVLYWRQDRIKSLKFDILQDLQVDDIIDIKRYLQKYDPMIVFRTVKEMQNEYNVVKNKGPVYIKDDIFFVDPTFTGSPNSNFYMQYKMFPTKKNLNDLIRDWQFNGDLNKAETVCDNPDIFDGLSKTMQAYVWEEAWLKKDLSPKYAKIAEKRKVYKVGDNIYNTAWAEPNYDKKTNLLVYVEDPTKIKVLRNGRWEYVNYLVDNIPTLAKKFNDLEKNRLMNYENEYGFVGFMDKGIFKIREFIGKHTRGKACVNYTDLEQVDFFYRLGVLKDYDTDDIESVSPDLPKSYSLVEKEQATEILMMTDTERCKELKRQFIRKKAMV